MLPKQIVRFLKFFDICGFNIQSTNPCNGQKFNDLITGVHILIVISFTIYDLFYIYEFYNSAGLVETINELMELFAIICPYVLIIFDSVYHSHAQKRFWTVLQQLNENFCCSSNLIPRSYITKLIEFFSAKLILDFITLIYNGFNAYVDQEQTYLIYLTYMVPVKICQIRIFYYIFCLEAVLFHMKHFHLNQIEKKWNRNLDFIHELIQLVNEIFGVSHVITVLICFFILFTDINYVHIHFHNLSATKLIPKRLNHIS